MVNSAPFAIREGEDFVTSSISAERNAKQQSLFSVAGSERHRLAVPRRGHVLSTIVEVYGKPIREAVGALAAVLAERDCSRARASLIVSCTEPAQTDVVRSDSEMAAWAVVSMWVVGVAIRALPVTTTLLEAEKWFWGFDLPGSVTALCSGEAVKKAEATLRSSADASAYLELLPYILDPHGPGSRLSVRRNPSTRAAQKRKRDEGVFYTPADVAEYMAHVCISELGCSNTAPTVFDPACGTGVFLRAALHEICRQHPGKNIFSLAIQCAFGADIDPWPVDAAAFVLLADSWGDFVGQGRAPVRGWRQLRANLAAVDTLRIDGGEDKSAKDVKNCEGSSTRIPISQLFPPLGRGPTVVLGNPPYADLGHRSDFAELGHIFGTLAVKLGSNAEIYLPFIEQMIRLADPQGACSGALVLPLSIACNVGPQFSVARELISKTRGRWRFAFFDREPHALFGEDVKTRNAIILWSRALSDRGSVLATGPLRKWRGDSRAAMFMGLRFTVVDTRIRAGIPKIEGSIQAAALSTLVARWNRLEQAVLSIERLNLDEMQNADEHTVFVGPTAYNFLNVFLKPEPGLVHGSQTLSEHPLHALRCASKRDALAVFAILSSHLAYWWWHTHGDGFHVSKRFLAELPIGMDAFSPTVLEAATQHGAELWSLIKESPIISLNRGKTSLAFTPNGHEGVRRKIDQLLAGLAGLPNTLVDELQQFTAHTVAATLRKHGVAETQEKETA